jgi:hypothetical protein
MLAKVYWQCSKDEAVLTTPEVASTIRRLTDSAHSQLGAVREVLASALSKLETLSSAAPSSTSARLSSKEGSGKAPAAAGKGKAPVTGEKVKVPLVDSGKATVGAATPAAHWPTTATDAAEADDTEEVDSEKLVFEASAMLAIGLEACVLELAAHGLSAPEPAAPVESVAAQAVEEAAMAQVTQLIEWVRVGLTTFPPSVTCALIQLLRCHLDVPIAALEDQGLPPIGLFGLNDLPADLPRASNQRVVELATQRMQRLLTDEAGLPALLPVLSAGLTDLRWCFNSRGGDRLLSFTVGVSFTVESQLCTCVAQLCIFLLKCVNLFPSASETSETQAAAATTLEAAAKTDGPETDGRAGTDGQWQPVAGTTGQPTVVTDVPKPMHETKYVAPVATGDEAVERLSAMFPAYDKEILSIILAECSNNVEAAMDQLLQMSEGGGCGSGGGGGGGEGGGGGTLPAVDIALPVEDWFLVALSGLEAHSRTAAAGTTSSPKAAASSLSASTIDLSDQQYGHGATCSMLELVTTALECSIRRFPHTYSPHLDRSFAIVERCVHALPVGRHGTVLYDVAVSQCFGATPAPAPALAVARAAPAILAADPIGSDLSAHGTKFKWSGGVWANGRIYLVPCNSNRILRIDPTTNAAEPVGPDLSAHASGYKWSDGVLGADGRIYFVPFNADRILRFDPATDAADPVGPDLSAHGGGKWWGGVLGADGQIYFVPSRANRILRFDPATDVAEPVGPDLSAHGGGIGIGRWIGGVRAADGRIYLVPSDANRIVRLDPATDTAEPVGPDLSADAGGAKWIGGVLSADGQIYFAPCRANRILRFDPTTNAAVHVGPDLSAHGGGKGKWYGGVLGTDGRIYFVPSHANHVLRLDPATNAAEPVGPDLSA